MRWVGFDVLVCKCITASKSLWACLKLSAFDPLPLILTCLQDGCLHPRFKCSAGEIYKSLERSLGGAIKCNRYRYKHSAQKYAEVLGEHQFQFQHCMGTTWKWLQSNIDGLACKSWRNSSLAVEKVEATTHIVVPARQNLSAIYTVDSHLSSLSAANPTCLFRSWHLPVLLMSLQHFVFPCFPWNHSYGNIRSSIEQPFRMQWLHIFGIVTTESASAKPSIAMWIHLFNLAIDHGRTLPAKLRNVIWGC